MGNGYSALCRALYSQSFSFDDDDDGPHAFHDFPEMISTNSQRSHKPLTRICLMRIPQEEDHEKSEEDDEFQEAIDDDRSPIGSTPLYFPSPRRSCQETASQTEFVIITPSPTPPNLHDSAAAAAAAIDEVKESLRSLIHEESARTREELVDLFVNLVEETIRKTTNDILEISSNPRRQVQVPTIPNRVEPRQPPSRLNGAASGQQRGTLRSGNLPSKTTTTTANTNQNHNGHSARSNGQLNRFWLNRSWNSFASSSSANANRPSAADWDLYKLTSGEPNERVVQEHRKILASLFERSLTSMFPKKTSYGRYYTEEEIDSFWFRVASEFNAAISLTSMVDAVTGEDLYRLTRHMFRAYEKEFHGGAASPAVVKLEPATKSLMARCFFHPTLFALTRMSEDQKNRMRMIDPNGSGRGHSSSNMEW